MNEEQLLQQVLLNIRTMKHINKELQQSLESSLQTNVVLVKRLVMAKEGFEELILNMYCCPQEIEDIATKTLEKMEGENNAN